ncbi:MAG: hypothetical protein JWM88_481 [Verrucomicrobia bacterium]|nr:hypothetical protein [Verrucomicrobiota bacterium]
MKKTFPLHAPGKADGRVVDAIKADIRRYVRRERGKALPKGADLWEIDCAVGLDSTTAVPKPLAEVSQAIDAVVSTGADSVYVEVLAKPGVRGAPAPTPSPS